MDGPIGWRVAGWFALANALAAAILGGMALWGRHRTPHAGT